MQRAYTMAAGGGRPAAGLRSRSSSPVVRLPCTVNAQWSRKAVALSSSREPGRRAAGDDRGAWWRRGALPLQGHPPRQPEIAGSGIQQTASNRNHGRSVTLQISGIRSRSSRMREPRTLLRWALPASMHPHSILCRVGWLSARPFHNTSIDQLGSTQAASCVVLTPGGITKRVHGVSSPRNRSGHLWTWVPNCCAITSAIREYTAPLWRMPVASISSRRAVHGNAHSWG